jgi:tetratricopeptide (TPR) repeat protein
MADCLNYQNKLQEAEELILYTLRDEENAGAFKMADTLYTLGNLRIAQKDLDRAFDSFKKSYALFKDDLGERHRLTANCCYCLGWILSRQRKYGPAM